MDFGKLLYAAHKNDKSTNKDVKCYKTKFEPPKKEIKTKTNLSANIQKYLQKRDEEERRKAEEEKRKKEELLLLRSQDRKSFKRVQTMLKRTKSANKSVMEDAIDDVNTAVTMAGPQQCDEDDYGYVSQEASAFYEKLMNKYTSMPPEEPKFPQGKKPVVKDLNAAKDRVRAALQREEEEEMMPHKRKRKSKTDHNDEENGRDHDESKRRSRESSPVDEPKPKKPKKMAPPPLDFSQLLKIAEQKQFEPIKIEKKVREEDNERPMTKKQKIEYERERERMERKLERENGMKNGQRKSETLNRIPKVSSSGERKDSLSGLGRIPKKNITVESSEKMNNNIDDKVNRKNSIDSERGYNNTDNARSRDGNLHEKNQSRSNHQSRNEQAKRNNKFDDSRIRSNNQSEIVKHERSNKDKRSSSLDSDSVCNYSDEERSRNHTHHEINHSKTSLQSKSDQVRKNYQSTNRVKSNHQSNIDKRERSNELARRSNSQDSYNVRYDTDDDHPRNNNHHEKYQSKNTHQSRNDQERKSYHPDRYRIKSNNQSDMDRLQRNNGTVNRKESHVTDSGGNYSDDEHPKSNSHYDRNQFRSSSQSSGDKMKNRYKSDSNREKSRSMQRDERKPDERLMSQRPSQGRPSLLQAAAAAAAARAAAGKSEMSSKSRDSGSEHKAERLPTGRSSENVSSLKQSMTASNKPKEGVVNNTRPNEHSSSNTKPKQFPPSDLRPKQFPPKDLKPKQFPPNDLKPRPFPPKDVRGRQFPPSDVKRRPNKPRRIEDSSEEEYDSEMDDFIDDGTDMDREEISQQIRSIFGYDKNKYIGLNGDDDECEESNFGQIDQEEYRSLRIGAQEDYIELMRDQAEKERKKKRKLEMMKRGR